MSTQDKDIFTEIVDIVLHKYNSVDSKLWGLVKRNDNHRKINENSVLIGVDDFKKIIIDNFKNEINAFNAVEGALAYKEATSVYFIWKLLIEMAALRWIKINLIKNANYSRIVEVDEIKTIKFSIKTVRGTFRTFDHFNKHDLHLVNSILVNSKILLKDEHYKKLRLSDFISKLDVYLTSVNTSEVAQAMGVFAEALEPYELDNPEVLIITDYDSDI